MNAFTNGWRRASLAIATFAVMGGASAQEGSDTLGTLLLDPEFEQRYIDTISRVLEDARFNTNNGSFGPDLSIQNLRQDPDFDDALNRRVEDVIEEKLFEQQTAGADDGNRLGAEFNNAPPRSFSPRSLDTLRVDADTPYVWLGFAASLPGDSCIGHVPYELKLWANGKGLTVAAAEKAAGKAAEKAAANHVTAIKPIPEQYCHEDCPEGRWVEGPTANPAPGKGIGYQGLFDIALDWADAMSLPWFRTYHASADWSVTGTVHCFGRRAPALVTAIPNTARVETLGSLAGE